MPQLKRVPVLTLVVVAVTAVISAVSVASPTVLAHLERTPAGLHEQWWRTITSLVTQSSAGGAASNLFFMLVLGVVAEQIASRSRWLACYLGAGIVGELVGYAWQPVGAGNSVAVCGLAAGGPVRGQGQLGRLGLALPRFGGLAVVTAPMRAWLPR